MIRAEVHSDDGACRANFDATPFFERASLDDLVGLRFIGWAGNYRSDAVALFMLERDAQVGRVFAHVLHKPHTDGGDPLGFECAVCERDVVRWVHAQRPLWLRHVWPQDSFAIRG
jgi:hypothetical protein